MRVCLRLKLRRGKGGENSKIMIRNMKKGFTLIELLVVIGIIGILAAVVLVAVNPGRQFAQARDTQRRSDLLTITNAIYQFAAEHDGNLPDNDNDDTRNTFPGGADSGVTETCIGTAAACASNPACGTAAAFNLATAGAEDGPDADTAIDDPIVPTYIADVPSDPSIGDDADTAYCISLGSDGRVTAEAEGELTNPITVAR